MPDRSATARFKHDGTEYSYAVHNDAERQACGSQLEAIDGSNEPLCLGVGGAWLIHGPRALLESLAHRRGMAFEDAGCFIFSCEDDDEETRQIPAGYVLFHFFELPALLVAEPFLRRFVGAFGVAALSADAEVGRLDPTADARTALSAAFAALAAEPGAVQ